jgi:hypothetical protein
MIRDNVEGGGERMYRWGGEMGDVVARHRMVSQISWTTTNWGKNTLQ